MDLGLKGKTVLVAAGSRGMGRAVAEGFLREDAAVTICARDAAALERTRIGMEFSRHGGPIGNFRSCAPTVEHATDRICREEGGWSRTFTPSEPSGITTARARGETVPGCSLGAVVRAQSPPPGAAAVPHQSGVVAGGIRIDLAC